MKNALRVNDQRSWKCCLTLKIMEILCDAKVFLKSGCRAYKKKAKIMG